MASTQNIRIASEHSPRPQSASCRFRALASWMVCLFAIFVSTAAQAVHLPAPTVEKAFSLPALVYVGGTIQMTITLTNNASNAITGVQFTDSYPNGMANAPSGVVASNTCGGTLTADPNGLSAALSNGTIPPNIGASCQIVLNVTGTPAGAGNTLTNHTGPVISSNAFGGADATATLSVAAAPLVHPPVVTMTLLSDTMVVGGQSVIEIGFANPNTTADLSSVQFATNYPMPSHIANVAGGIVINTCTTPDHVYAPSNGTSLSMTDGFIPAGGFCVLAIQVTGTSVGNSDLHTGPVLNAEATPGVDATATLNVVSGSLLASPTVQKSFSPSSVKIGGTTQMMIAFTNSDANNAITGLQVSDIYPFGITNSPNGTLVRNTCGGQLTLRSDNPDYDLYLLNGTIPAGGSCSVVLNVVGTDQSFPHNCTSATTSGNAQTTDQACADMVVTSGPLLGAPTASKAFVPTTIGLGDISQMTIALSNANAFPINGAQFTDPYPDGIANAPSGAVVSNTCGGTLTADPNGSFAALANGTIPGPGNCKVVINVIGKQGGSWVNQTGLIPAANAQTGASVIGGLSVQAGATLAAPTVSKDFVPQSVTVGGSAQMTITLTNNDAVNGIAGVEFTDPYPGGMANAPSNVVDSNTCGGTVTAAQNGLSAALANGTIPAGGACKVVINVVGTAQGSSVNHTGPVNSTNANPGADATAMLTVVAVPDLTLTKTHVGNFSWGQIGATYTLTANNAGTGSSSGTVTVTDTLPASFTATAMSGTGWTCMLATTSCTRSDALAAGSSYPAITLTVNVAANAPASVTNTASVSGGGETNTANDSASDPTTIGLAAPMVSKAFEPASVTVGGTSQMSITLINPNNFTALTGVQLTDNYPAGMANASSNVLVSSTCGGAITADPNGTSVTLTNGTVPPSQACIIRINVVGTSTGNAVNHTGAVTSANANAGADATATLSVTSGLLLPAPTMTKAFAPANIIVGGSSQMTITLSNANASAILGAQFADDYPQGMTESTFGVLNNTCGGVLDEYPDSIALVNGTIPAQGSCSIVVQITGTTGTFVNQTSPVASGNALTGNGASATLTVVPGVLLPAPTVTKAFAPASVLVGGTSQMTITLTNHDPNNAISGAQIFDPYPPHMANAPGNVVVSNTCGGTVMAAPNDSLMILGNGTIAANNSCSVVINVVGTSVGTVDNHTNIVLSGNANGSADASATLTVANGALLTAPTVTKAFAPSSVPVGGASQMTITLSNSNGSAIAGAQFTDSYPTGMANASGNVLVSDSCGGIVTAAPNASLMILGNGTIAANNSCSVVINVVGTSVGTVDNHVGTVLSGNANGSADASAILAVTSGGAGADLTLTKSHAGNFSQGQIGAVYTLTANNLGAGATSGVVTVTDTLPASLTATAMSGPGWVCTPATTSCTRSDPLPAGSSYPAITLTVNVAANAPASVTNTASVSGGSETNTGNDAASDPTTIDSASAVADLTLTKSHAGNFSQGQMGAVYTLTAHNVGAAATTGFFVSVADTLPAALTATAMSGPGWVCTPATTSCTRSDTLAAGASYPAITLTVNVAANAPASVTNTASVSGGGETNTANDTASDPTTITPNGGNVADLTLTKSHVGNFSQGQTGAVYTLTANNIGAAATSGTVTVTDALPASLTATGMSGPGWTCTPATTSCTRSDTLAAGASFPAITLTVNVAANAPPSVTNTASVSGGGETNTGNDTASDPTTIGSGAGNHAPVAVGDAIEVASGGQTNVLVGDPIVPSKVLDNDFDADNDTLTATQLSNPTHGTANVLPDGEFTYQNNGTGTTDSFTYKACDASQCSAETTVTVTIGNGLDNHVPFAVGDAIQVAPNGITSAIVGDAHVPNGVLDNDIDPDGQALTAAKLTNPTHGDLNAFHADGTFSYHNTDPASPTDGFLYQVCDPNGACDLGVVTITIGNNLSDHAPIVVDDAIQVTPNAPGNVTHALIGDLNVPSSVLDNDSDPDAGDTLTAVKVSGLLNDSGTLDFDAADGTFTYTYTNPVPTTDSFLYEACDAEGSCKPGLVSIAITNAPLDLPPIGMDDAIQVAPNGMATTLVGDANVPNSVLDNDSDPNDAHTTLKAYLISPPVNGQVTLHLDGTFTYVNTNPIADAFQYEVCDPTGACAPATVSVTINGNAPTVSCVLPTQVDEVGDAVNLDLSLLFTPPSGQSLTYSATNPPPSLSIIGSLLTGTLSASGMYTSALNATTVPGGVSASENVTFQVLPAGDILLRNGFDDPTQAQPCQ